MPGSSPNWNTGYVPPASEWNTWWGNKADFGTTGTPMVPSIAALRLVNLTTMPSTLCLVVGYYGTVNGGGGPFAVDSSDTTSADNAGTIIVDAIGRRWKRQTNGGPLNGAWFGMYADGGHVDNVALQAAVDALPALTGGAIDLPPGSPLITASININTPNVCISGCGVNGTKIFVPVHNFDIFVTTKPGFVLSDVGVAGAAPASGATAFFIVADRSTAQAASGMQVKNVNAGFIHSFTLTQSSLLYMDNCYGQDLCTTFGVGVYVNQRNNSGQGTIVDCTFQNGAGNDARAGVLIESCAAITLLNVQGEKMGNPFWLIPSAGMTVFSVKMNNCWADTSTGTGILLDGSVGLIERVSATSGWVGGCGAGVQTIGTVNGFSINDYDVFGNTADGIKLTSTTSTTGIAITNNRIAGNGANGVEVAAGVLNFGIVGNTIGAFADFGANGGDGVVVAAGASDDYLIVGNRLRNNTGSSLVDGGTGTSKTVANNLV